MKQIGRSIDGYIVEMTEDEVLAYDRLARVVEGASVWEVRDRRDPFAVDDLGTALDCVTAFASIVGTLNEVEQAVSMALAALKGKNKEA